MNCANRQRAARAREKRVTRRRQTDASSAHSFLLLFSFFVIFFVLACSVGCLVYRRRSQFKTKNIGVVSGAIDYIAISLQLFRQQYNALNMYDQHADCLDVFTLHMPSIENNNNNNRHNKCCVLYYFMFGGPARTRSYRAQHILFFLCVRSSSFGFCLARRSHFWPRQWLLVSRSRRINYYYYYSIWSENKIVTQNNEQCREGPNWRRRRWRRRQTRRW